MAHILAVDDDADLRALLRTALERDGHTVQLLHSGAEVTQQHCAWADCILLDVMMPGEDGFATCRRIRSLAGCPILFLTARTAEEDILRGLGLGGDDYLAKPFRSPSCGPASTPICGGRTGPGRRIRRGASPLTWPPGKPLRGKPCCD